MHPVHRIYEWWLGRALSGGPRPRHVGLVMDGNRRWARAQGLVDPNLGHRAGAEHVEAVLGWCREWGIGQVTVYVASVDNLRKRDAAEVGHLLHVVETVVAGRLARPDGVWRVHLAGRLDLLPDSTRHALKLAEDRTSHLASGSEVTIAIGYDGRIEVVDALRSLLHDEAARGGDLRELAGRITEEEIAAHLYTAGRPEADLVIRTSGEQRLSGFLLWQSARARLHFCDANWPGFRKVDFLRALRAFARRG
ncbi:isoprenyl transferase [Pseudonocardia ailaonensis]|uniref:Isoprenyl transferase n=1 Tax=Pseudonocardia ailaonensis TaxID=367279 RepID=A0ABN2N5E9_9PSEU